MPRWWVSTRGLVEAGTTPILAKPAPAAQVAQPAPAAQVAQPAPAAQVAQPAPAAQVAQPAPAAQVTQPAPAAQLSAMGEFPSDEPSLASRARPEMASAIDRHSAFLNAYSHPDARTETKDRKTRIRALQGSSNVTLRGTLGSGETFYAKPHAGAAWGHPTNPMGGEISRSEREQMSAAHEPKEWSKRHDAMYRVMSAMGAHHMVPVGISGNMHGNLKDTLAPDESDSEHKAMHMPWTHAGQDAHVTESAGPHQVAGWASDQELAKVDNEHRLHGMVAHALFGHSDGHKENVLIHEAGHPVLIDHDFMLDSKYSNKINEMDGMTTITSVFAPGGLLDYRANRSDDVGVNYPPRMKSTLEWLASGGHMKGKDMFSLNRGDAQALQRNAQSLLQNGLEGHLGGLKVRTGG